MTFNTYGDSKHPTLLLIPGLGVSFEIFLPLIELMKTQYRIVAVGIDGLKEALGSGKVTINFTIKK